MGSVYSRKRSPYLWIKYHQHGRAVRESTRNEESKPSHDECCGRARAMSNAASRSIRTSAGSRSTKRPRICSTTTRRIGSAPTSMRKRRIKKHLAPFFGNRRMITITTTELRAYVAKRLADGTPVRQKRRQWGQRTKGLYRTCQDGRCQPARSIASSRCSSGCSASRSRPASCVHKPHFPMLRENNVRAGFFEREQYLAVLTASARRPCNRS